MTKLSSLLALILAGLMLLSVSLFDPAAISGWIEGLVGLHPLQERAEAPPDLQVQSALATITPQKLEQHLRAFTSHSSRIAGYPGARHAAAYIEEQFRSLGLEQVRSETFSLPVPVDRGGKVRIIETGQEFPIYGLWPNHVRTPTLPAGGIEGHLIDAGEGRLSELDGQQVEGSVVLMDFACEDRYLDARMLGAQAILFCDQGQATRSEAEEKFLQVPVDIPRFWIEPEAAAALRVQAGKGAVHLESRMDWEEVEARNLIGVLPGLDQAMPLGQRQQQQVWKDQVIVLHAYYDAVSVVPALAPGAESATGIAALLEIARLLKEQGTRYTVLFLATAGHFEGLAGVNDFLYRHTRKSKYFSARIAPQDRLDFRLFIGLDLSSHSPTVASFGTGTFYNSAWATDDYQKNLIAHYATQFGRYNREVFGDSSRYLDAVAPAKRTWKNYMPVRLAFDSEAVTFVGKEALAFATPNQVRERVDTPHDRLEFVDLEGLAAQTRTLGGLLLKAASAPDFFNDTKLELQDWGHSLEGHVYWFDRKVNFAVPKSPVSGALVTYVQPGPNSVGGVRTLIATYTGREGAERGHFKFPIMRNRLSNRIQAFELDDEGRVVSAPDLGEEGDKTYPGLQGYGWWENRMLQVVFRCQALSFLEVVDPRYLSALDRIAVLGGNDASPRSFGYSYVENQSAQEDRVVQAGVVFAQPGTRVKILAGDGAFGSTGALANVRYLLSNADPQLLRHPLDPEEADMDAVARAQGKGYPVEAAFLFKPALLAARDLWIIDDARMKQLARYGI
ncbi:MAG: M28 family peptidase, partial [Candidatus Latescibacteria bacterium]|nr:M28 family peptidase [Candidatus Latescibacterota bacterium]